MDLSKAFDTLDHKILLEKFKYYGITKITLSWFKSYLSNRSSYVIFNNTRSNININSIGVPQGSILGPLLFIIYINGMSCSTSFFDFIFYADVTSLLNTSLNFDNMQTSYTVNIELDKVYTWLCVNRLSLNIKKTKFMIFHSIHKKIPIIPLIKINNISIDKVTDFDFLGLTLNENMKWHSHINKISTKISRAIGVIYKLRQYLPLYILKTLYHSLVLPHLTYGIIAWHSYSDPIFKLQKRIVRIIANSSYNAHSEPLFKQLNLLKIGDIYIDLTF